MSPPSTLGGSKGKVSVTNKSIWKKVIREELLYKGKV